ncbi:MAG: Holliday junction branch migration protein RuvA [Desulfobulbus propionicus]|nr:MAG: Holliday junction branch migration protein RuvA [Desulfobulbus propionicus]
MIASLSGILQFTSPFSAVIAVQGVGYEVQLSARTVDRLPRVGEEVFLYVHTSVREDAITLFGFFEIQEKELFLLLNTVSGVGPKLALAILGGIGTAELCEALRLKDIGRLTGISGVGKKTAQRLCVELGEKVGGDELIGTTASVMAAASPVTEGHALQDAASALVNLGYSESVAWQALRSVQQQDPQQAGVMTVEELLRRALQALAR